MTDDGLIFVKPAEGRLVRDHRTMLPVPKDGQFVVAGDPHWMASLNFGDLVESEPPEEPKPAAAEVAAPEPEPTQDDALIASNE